MYLYLGIPKIYKLQRCGKRSNGLRSLDVFVVKFDLSPNLLHRNHKCLVDSPKLYWGILFKFLLNTVCFLFLVSPFQQDIKI